MVNTSEYVHPFPSSVSILIEYEDCVSKSGDTLRLRVDPESVKLALSVAPVPGTREYV